MQVHGGENEMTCVDERLYQDAKEVAVTDLVLDPKNVRFQHMTILSEKQREEWMFQEEDVRLLIRQIVRDRKIQQPIYVVEDGQGHYIVKEGNRRTVALRKIRRDIIAGKIKGFEKDHFDIVSVHVIKGTEHEIKVFLGQLHVSGPKDWNAVNKAYLIYDLVDKEGDSIDSVAEELGMTKGKVDHYYRAFQATIRYGKRYPNDTSFVPKFSYFMELYQSKPLKTWLQEDPTNLDYFIDLVGKNKLKVTYKGVRQFAKVIDSPNPNKARALAVLDAENGDIEKAYSVIVQSGVNEKGVWPSLEKILNTLPQTRYEDIVLAKQDPSKLQLLEHLIEFAGNMKKDIQKLLASSGAA